MLLLNRCELVLGEFLKEIKKNPSSVKFAEMANILVIHCQVSDESKSSESDLKLCIIHFIGKYCNSLI